MTHSRTHLSAARFTGNPEAGEAQNAAPIAGLSALAGAGCDRNCVNVAWQDDNRHEAAGVHANSAGYRNSLMLAPNCPAGIAQIRASGADSVFFFLPGGMGIAFMKQYAESGVGMPLAGPAFPFDENILQAVGDAALGVKNTSLWNKDIDTPAKAAFVAACQAEYGRLPSPHSSQGFDTANLLLSAMARADVADQDALRAALGVDIATLCTIGFGAGLAVLQPTVLQPAVAQQILSAGKRAAPPSLDFPARLPDKPVSRRVS